MKIIELTGSTKRERIIQAMQHCGWYEGRCVDISPFEKHYGDNLLPTARKFFQEFYGLPKYLAIDSDCLNFDLNLYIEKDAQIIFNSHNLKSKNPYDEKVNFLGVIGYYYPSWVWIDKNGKIYTFHTGNGCFRRFNSFMDFLEDDLWNMDVTQIWF